MTISLKHFEYKQEQLRTARRQAADLRELHLLSRCGLDIKINYGTKHVPQHIAMRISDQFPIWADEYDAVAEALEKELEGSINDRLTSERSDSMSAYKKGDLVRATKEDMVLQGRVFASDSQSGDLRMELKFATPLLSWLDALGFTLEVTA